MAFLFNLVFWIIFIIVATLFLFYLPVPTLIFLGVVLAISVTIAIVAYKIDNKK